MLDAERMDIALASTAGGGQSVAAARLPGPASQFIARALRLQQAGRILALGNESAALAASGARGLCISAGMFSPSLDGSRAIPSSNVRASQALLPFASSTFDAAAELRLSRILTADSDSEASLLAVELARVMKPGGRFLCGAPAAAGNLQPRHLLSNDKRRIDDWRREGGDIVVHTLRTARADGSWNRLHERLRLRSLDQIVALLRPAGFSLLNTFSDYAQAAEEAAPRWDSIFLCRRT